jgi:O-methyltransferase
MPERPPDAPTDAAKARFMETVYAPFRQRVRRDLFLAIAVYHYQNQPVDGYYLEFGCHGARTMRLAWDTFHPLFDRTYVAFDSFRGLPPLAPHDRMPVWSEGGLATSAEEFRGVLRDHGMPEGRLVVVEGFFAETLTPATAARLLPTKAAVVYVDCDLYESTVPVLEFARPFLGRGTVVVFDDWFCFHGDPALGERRAFAEFRARHPGVVFEEFVQTSEAKAFVVLEAP